MIFHNKPGFHENKWIFSRYFYRICGVKHLPFKVLCKPTRTLPLELAAMGRKDRPKSAPLGGRTRLEAQAFAAQVNQRLSKHLMPLISIFLVTHITKNFGQQERRTCREKATTLTPHYNLEPISKGATFATYPKRLHPPRPC